MEQKTRKQEAVGKLPHPNTQSPSPTPLALAIDWNNLVCAWSQFWNYVEHILFFFFF